MSLMVQCEFRKGSKITTAYVDKKQNLRVGSIVELKDKDEDKDGWRVMSIGKELDAKYVMERSQDYKRQREASDI